MQITIFKIDSGCNGPWNHTEAKITLGGPIGRQHGHLLSELRFFGCFNILSIISINFI